MDTRSRKHNKNQLVDENVIRGKKKVNEQHLSLVEVVDSEEPEIEVDDLQLYAAHSAIALLTEETNPHQRILHESEVQIPHTVRQAMASPQRAEWWKGMERELAAMEEKYVLELVLENDVPEGTKILETMWRFQAKTDELGNILRYRPRLWGRGDKEVPGVDFNVLDTFSPVARMASFRVMIALCKIFKLLAFQCDINTAYLNARRKVVRYIRRIAGFPIKPGGVHKVNNALYGLHESGREWYDELHGWLTAKGLQRSSTESCLYYYIKGETIALVLVYVDDVICATNSESWKTQLFADLNDKYGIKDLGASKQLFRIEWQNDGVLLHQTKYAKEILERFGFADACGCRSPMDTTVKLRAATKADKETSMPYHEMIGALMYLATSTRPDIAFPVGYLSRFVQHPSVEHAGALKRVLKYLAATPNHGIIFKNQTNSDAENVEINGFVDADWGNCPDTRKSVSGYVMKIAEGPVAWAARRQNIVALSAAEAEYAAACEACEEGKSTKNILSEIVRS
ncbi:LOW QUALITY PROTEIN: Integrase catalytic core protein [Phytophthora palmivora]|uniref:Integrase catalytic core protein n=1 Tax=Phytophthora palmivora TaxID=4796 RepID=A0A2P4X3B6_9STRA|nr:LOW QUALITY PROTEIN: Integrase catalytic core protein [Phytophthora palmivora]